MGKLSGQKSNPPGIRCSGYAPRASKTIVFSSCWLQLVEKELLDADNRSNFTNHTLQNSTIAVHLRPIHPTDGYRRELLSLWRFAGAFTLSHPWPFEYWFGMRTSKAHPTEASFSYA